MERKMWVRLDNASNIFLAAMSAKDPKVFRLTAEMSEEIDPLLLQEALDKTYEQFALYHSVLRRGFFWYYLEMSDLHPKVLPETLPPCSQIYHFDRKELLFRVIYYKNRLHLEIFHVLADGTGALWFFEDLLKEYVLLKYPDQFEGIEQEERDQIDQLLQDSFSEHFRHQNHQLFLESARSAFRSIVKTSKRAGKLALNIGKKTSAYIFLVPEQIKKKTKVYRVKGKRTPDNRPHVIELRLPLQNCLTLAREQNVSLTIYMTALFFEAVRKANEDFKSDDTISVSVPVNLRQFFPSGSARNFFSTTRLEYTYGKKEDTLNDICQELDNQFKFQLNAEKLERRLNKLIAFEYNPLGRLIPRPLKDLILKGVNWKVNQNLTLAISNLGKFRFPTVMESYIKHFFFHTSAIRPQFCMISYKDDMTITFTSPFIETAIQKEFARMLTAEGMSIAVSVNQVTAEEMEVD